MIPSNLIINDRMTEQTKLIFPIHYAKPGDETGQEYTKS